MRNPTLVALSLSMLLPSAAVGIANVGLPTLATAFDASFDAVQWVVIAYLLATTTAVVGAGRLGDLVGRRRLLLTGVAVFTLGTLLCGLAPTLPWLIAARAVQGVAAAAMMALTMAFVAEVVPADRTGRAMGLLGTMSAVGTAAGPSLGGVLISAFGWRMLFLAIVPLGVVGFVLAARTLPRPSMPDRPRFDLPGLVLLAVTLGAYTSAVTLDRHQVPSLLVAAVGLVAFVVVENRVAAPLVALAGLREPGLAAGLTSGAVVSAVVMTTLVVGPFHLGTALGLAPAWVGLAMSTGPVVAALAGVPAGRLTDRVGTRTAVLAGLVAMVAGSTALALLPVGAGVVGYVASLVTITAGYAVFQAANNTAVLRDVPGPRRGVVSGLLTLSRNLGLTTGASVMGAVFAATAHDVTLADQVARGTRWTFAVAAAGLVVALGISSRTRRLARTRR
ncbi:MFS transporter [Saccharothrix violaceirubra]|uniref:EmrB/QacA subfamily drug resistance transporter n=1 Tax=Saccharothrix violaceirubra TaxID=413306 RepID=A0A7W7T4I3_9PSEU|nr:MFS transporter [Saccharothrix violaceirubra]MBB4966414.1 EmrB/QacA subfamily drug resistance transporter [Saccharothrix violaceirubra]